MSRLICVFLAATLGLMGCGDDNAPSEEPAERSTAAETATTDIDIADGITIDLNRFCASWAIGREAGLEDQAFDVVRQTLRRGDYRGDAGSPRAVFGKLIGRCRDREFDEEATFIVCLEIALELEDHLQRQLDRDAAKRGAWDEIDSGDAAGTLIPACDTFSRDLPE